MVTLSAKAGWVLARLMGCFDPPANLARMEADGITPLNFADQDFADKNLLGRELTIELEYVKGRDGKDYPEITPVKPEPSTAPPPATAEDDPPPAAAPAAVANDDGPPPTETPAGMTKEEAWEHVKGEWAGNSEPDAKAQRNRHCAQSIEMIGKPEAEFTPQDWAKVADAAGMPF